MTAGAAPRRRPPLFTASFCALIAAQSGFGFAFSSFFLLPKFLVGTLGASGTQLGLVMAAHGIAVVVGLPIAGALVDRDGRRRYLTAGALLMAASTLAFAAVEQVGPLIYVLRVLHALAFSMAFAAGGALAVDEAPPERIAQAVAIFGLSFLSMNAVAPPVVELVAARVGWSPAFALAALGALVCAALSRGVRDHVPARPAAEVPALPAVPRGTGHVYVVIALVGLALCAVFAFHQPYALALGIERVSDFFVAYAVTAITLRAGLGHLLDDWGHRRVVAIALAPYVLVLLAGARLDLVGLVPLGVGMGLAHGIVYPAWNAVALAAALPGQRGTVMALFQSAFNAGVGIGALGLGLLADAAGYPAVFLTGAAAVALALVIVVSTGARPSPGRSGGAHSPSAGGGSPPPATPTPPGAARSAAPPRPRP